MKFVLTTNNVAVNLGQVTHAQVQREGDTWLLVFFLTVRNQDEQLCIEIEYPSAKAALAEFNKIFS